VSGSITVGRGILVAAWACTVPFAVSVALAVVIPGGVTEGIAVGVAVALFFVGSGVALVAFGWGLVRSARGDDVAVANLFFLSGSAPRPVRRRFLLILLVSFVPVAISFANLEIAPYTWLALMVPVGFPGLWAARHGTFPARPEPTSPRRGR
jgi:hypothetical protein